LPTTSDPDEVAILIGREAWRHWDDLEVHLGLDSHPTVGFAAPFDYDRIEFRNAFRPFSFTPLQATLGGEPFFTGSLVEVVPRVGPESSTVACSGYSLPAGLEFTNLPADAVPFEASGLSLRQIAERLAGLYGITVVMDGPEGSTFKKVNTRQKKIDTKVEHDQKIDDFLVELAKQRGLVRTSTARGELLFWQSVKPGNPVARLIEGQPPLVSAVPTFSPQEYYSEITGFTSTKRGNPGARYTLRNGRLAGGVLRAFSFKLDDVEKADAPTAVRAKMGRMFANAVTYVVNLPTWRDPAGSIFKPNTTLTLHAPSAMVYTETELLVRDVFLKQNNSERTCSLGLVLPGAFSGEVPPRMPWEEAL
jgi:prophage tail gpP-like protein